MKRLITLGAVLVVAFVLLFVWWNFSLSPVNSSATNEQSFVITRGLGVREIARKLHEQGLIRDPIAFFVLVRNIKIQAGSFKLSPSMSAPQIAEKLTLGTEDVWITIPEGLRSEQILEILAEKRLGQGDIEKWRADEGKYFPETYLIPKLWNIDQVRQHLRAMFDQKFDAKLAADAKAAGLTPDEVVTLASIIERETQTDEDMPIVAGILLSRLNDDHPLQADATIHYLLGNKKNDWWPKEILTEDLKIPSPYNTYLNPGLPPAPIGNPGLTSIKAVIYPTKSDYYYYISDKAGKMHYAKTLEDHNQNVSKYLTN